MFVCSVIVRTAETQTTLDAGDVWRPPQHTSGASTRMGMRMLASTDRISTTHVGSLSRNEWLSDLLIRQEAGEAIDTKALVREIEAATAHVISAQVQAGVDIGNDGEQSRVAFQTYVPRCLCASA